MNPRTAITAAGLVTAALAFVLVATKDPVPEPAGRQERPAGASVPHVDLPASRRDPQDPGRPGSPGSAERNMTPPLPVGGYRFRPLERTPGATARQRPDGSAFGYPPSYPGADRATGDAGGGGMLQVPDTRGYRFRPRDESANTRRYQPYSRPGRPSVDSFGSHAFEMPRAAGPGTMQAPPAFSHRFRPLDEQQRSRRWQGNYRPMSVNPEQLAGPRDTVPVVPNPT